MEQEKTEPHAVDSNHSRYTNCVLCGESLDTLVDGPFIVRWSLANSPVVALNSYNIVLWHDLVYGQNLTTFFHPYLFHLFPQ